ncbi:NADH-quinone oxidoreductase subunit C [Hyperthermus butylicus]|uniref:NAD(P)H-quinone oxidoreductase subunit J n=1 Tax=Hyperthermus butylicus (strain DSM 5456 / JCM 9403 / PLM1-5) TaxID=415426 RepID=A2BJ95_HYPBU|nr:NADH-quinone oxidoreductase subunit C [Hyperthermus butylicus]ABM80056.1 NAD(P)H-quinone oxidoreductase subunit J [Hyperthermus butylicus DSM 5456]
MSVPLEQLAQKHGARIEKRTNYHALVVEPDRIREVVAELKNTGYDYLLSISGVDEPDAKRIRIVYHFARSSNPGDVVAVETVVPRDEPVIDSIHDVYPAALLHEREEHEMLGIVFRGNPDSRHLLLPEDWPEGVYPLRKDFKVVEESHMSTKPSKPVWILKPELKPKDEGEEKA